MQILNCYACGLKHVAFIVNGSTRLCVDCARAHFRRSKSCTHSLVKRIETVKEIDYNCHLDLVAAQLMALHITNGMSIRQCARQMGITHSTVYSKLRKYGMLLPAQGGEGVLNPTVGDFRTSGGLGKEFTIVSVKNSKKVDQKSVTRPAPGPKRSLSQAADSPGPESNARKVL